MNSNNGHKLLVLSLLLLLLISNIQNAMGLARAETSSTEQLSSYGTIKYPTESDSINIQVSARARRDHTAQNGSIGQGKHGKRTPNPCPQASKRSTLFQTCREVPIDNTPPRVDPSISRRARVECLGLLGRGSCLRVRMPC